MRKCILSNQLRQNRMALLHQKCPQLRFTCWCITQLLSRISELFCCYSNHTIISIIIIIIVIGRCGDYAAGFTIRCFHFLIDRSAHAKTKTKTKEKNKHRHQNVVPVLRRTTDEKKNEPKQNCNCTKVDKNAINILMRASVLCIDDADVHVYVCNMDKLEFFVVFRDLRLARQIDIVCVATKRSVAMPCWWWWRRRWW